MSDGSAARQLGGSAISGSPTATVLVRGAGPPSRRTAEPTPCNRCGFPVRPSPWGCKNPCGNCGTIYPHGDCSD